MGFVAKPIAKHVKVPYQVARTYPLNIADILNLKQIFATPVVYRLVTNYQLVGPANGSASRIIGYVEKRREDAVLRETPIILDLFDEEVSVQSRTPTANCPTHRRLKAKTDDGLLVLRIADAAASELVEALLTPTSGLDFSMPLRGSGPFNLPVAQTAKAHADKDAVLLCFRVFTELGRLVTVQIEVPRSQALELASSLAEIVSL